MSSEMIISLYAGGMTIRDIRHHMATAMRVDISHETISAVTDAVLVRLPSFSGHPICTDLVSVGEDVHCEFVKEKVHPGVPAGSCQTGHRIGTPNRSCSSKRSV